MRNLDFAPQRGTLQFPFDASNDLPAIRLLLQTFCEMGSSLPSPAHGLAGSSRWIEPGGSIPHPRSFSFPSHIVVAKGDGSGIWFYFYLTPPPLHPLNQTAERPEWPLINAGDPDSANRGWRFLSIHRFRLGRYHLPKINLFSWRHWARLVRPARESPRSPLPTHHSPRQLGQLGEQIAARYLASQGYQIVASNFRGPIGRRRDGRAIEGEIDLIAYDLTLSPAFLVFLEVKARRDDQLARPEAAVDQRKRLRIIRAARLYRRLLSLRDHSYRFDVVSILLPPNAPPQLTHLKNFFSDNF